MTKYIAFLRGINVGRNKKVPMPDLKNIFESLGFENVRTLLNSGNIIFEGSGTDAEKLEKELKSQFRFEIPVILRTADEIQKLIDSDPFKEIIITPDTRLYITFLGIKPRQGRGSPPAAESKLETQYISPDKNFKILQITEGEVISVLTLSPAFTTTEAMNVLEKEFGKKVTTRNWNTIFKML